MMNLTLFVIGMSLPVTIQHHCLLCFKCRNSRKLSERYGAEGSMVRVTQRAGFPKIMLLQKEVNSTVTDTILDSSLRAAAKILKEPLRDA